MPIRVPESLPARKALGNENIFLMPHDRAFTQDIRPLQLLLLNLMPTKIETEKQLLRLLSNTPLQLDIDFMTTASYMGKHTPRSHLDSFYQTHDKIKDKYYDGMIITGAPVETLEFEEVIYWDELKAIMNWSKQHVFSTLHICWGAQAALYHHYGVPKYPLSDKLFGVFSHRCVSAQPISLFRGLDDVFSVPHSRHTEIRATDVANVPSLSLLSVSDESGVFALLAEEGRQIFFTGHVEYDADTLKKEYLRDLDQGLPIKMPQHYFPENDPNKEPLRQWHSTGSLLFSNWLNYYVYQETPYVITTIPDTRQMRS